VGVWGWRQTEGWLRIVPTLALPIVLAAIWGTFAVPDDPSRSRAAPVAVAGLLRLLIELAIFSIATWTLYDLDYTRLSTAFGIVVMIHYMVSYDRVHWLLTK
jgi:hypothetical protein